MRGESPGENVKRKSGEREIRVEGDKEGRDFEGETEKKSTERENALEKEIATHLSVLAWRIPGTGEPGGLPSMESHTVIHN